MDGDDREESFYWASVKREFEARLIAEELVDWVTGRMADS